MTVRQKQLIEETRRAALNVKGMESSAEALQVEMRKSFAAARRFLHDARKNLEAARQYLEHP